MTEHETETPTPGEQPAEQDPADENETLVDPGDPASEQTETEPEDE